MASKGKHCAFEGELVEGATYVDGAYTYKYKREKSYGENWYAIKNGDGWGVALTNLESTDPVTTQLCSTINDKPILSMASMFRNSKAKSIDLSSFDTSNVKSMSWMFNSSSIKTVYAKSDTINDFKKISNLPSDLKFIVK